MGVLLLDRWAQLPAVPSLRSITSLAPRTSRINHDNKSWSCSIGVRFGTSAPLAAIVDNVTAQATDRFKLSANPRMGMYTDPSTIWRISCVMPFSSLPKTTDVLTLQSTS
eukprot:c19403_g1_i1.p2 GENE.c19403_g1_i1~~c19403_g1_i1.p2  ORF type:complete len:110 (+),score=7.27 c19403_g1_i1:87-416(+)